MNLLLTLSHTLLAWDGARTGIPNQGNVAGPVDAMNFFLSYLHTHFAIQVSISHVYAQILFRQFPKVEKVISIFLRFWDLCV